MTKHQFVQEGYETFEIRSEDGDEVLTGVIKDFVPPMPVGWSRAASGVVEWFVIGQEGKKHSPFSSKEKAYEARKAIRSRWVKRRRVKQTPARELVAHGNPANAQEFICRSCGLTLPMEKATVDHIQPKSKGGSDDFSNLQAMCQPCNVKKADT